MQGRQDKKIVDITEVFTVDSLGGVILQKLGARDDISKANVLQANAVILQKLKDMADRFQTKYGLVPFVLKRAIERLEQYGNYEIVSQLDAQSQAIVKTGDRPPYKEIE